MGSPNLQTYVRIKALCFYTQDSVSWLVFGGIRHLGITETSSVTSHMYFIRSQASSVFFFCLRLNFIMCVCVCVSLCVCVHMCVWCPHGSEDNVRSPRNGVIYNHVGSGSQTHACSESPRHPPATALPSTLPQGFRAGFLCKFWGTELRPRVCIQAL